MGQESALAGETRSWTNVTRVSERGSGLVSVFILGRFIKFSVPNTNNKALRSLKNVYFGEAASFNTFYTIENTDTDHAV